jgi:hypothetical protein
MCPACSLMQAPVTQTTHTSVTASYTRSKDTAWTLTATAKKTSASRQAMQRLSCLHCTSLQRRLSHTPFTPPTKQHLSQLHH